MNQPVRMDLTVIEGEPGLRAEMVFELATDELEAQRLRNEARNDQRGGASAMPLARTGGGSTAGRTRMRRYSPPPETSWAVHRSIVAVDIEGSTNRTNAVKGRLREAMYGLLEEALRAARIGEHICDPLVDRGDSALALIHASDDAPKIRLLDAVVPTLVGLLVEHNRHNVELGFRLRMVVHAGEVHWDGRGWYGEAVDVACRLLDAPEVKRVLVQASSPLVVVVSEMIHQSIVVQGYDGVDTAGFKPIAPVRVGGRRHRAWVYVPEGDSVGDVPAQPRGDLSLDGVASDVADVLPAGLA